MRFESFVATRYLRGKRKNRFVSLITIISMAGVCVGVMTLIVVISVMTGFDEELRETIIGNRAHMRVYPGGTQEMHEWPKAIEDIKGLNPEVIGAGPIIETEALLKNGEYTTGALIVGVDIDLETEVTDLATNLTNAEGREFGFGDLPGDKEIVLGIYRPHVDVGGGHAPRRADLHARERHFAGTHVGLRSAVRLCEYRHGGHAHGPQGRGRRAPAVEQS
jgi:lipoprotein-releasing system permease protein